MTIFDESVDLLGFTIAMDDSRSVVIMKKSIVLLILFTLGTHAIFATADETGMQDKETLDSSEAEMAQKLANPLAAMISLPMQLNYDQDFGVDDTGDRFLMNVQPVVPITLTKDWNLISRTIVPVVTQDELFAGAGRQTGLGDTVQSLWFSPAKPTDKGLVWGIGPVILLPTATDDLLGGGKWGLGPTAVALRQVGPWTYGGLVNHIWSVAGSGNRNDISSTFFQPFITYNTPSAVTYALNLESTYDWKSEQWAIPVNFMVSKLVRFDKQMVSFQGGIRYWAKSTDSGPEGLGLRFAVTFLFPR
jgi:hypothetical protein